VSRFKSQSCGHWPLEAKEIEKCKLNSMTQFQYHSLVSFTGYSVSMNASLSRDRDREIPKEAGHGYRDKMEPPNIRLLTILPGQGDDKISCQLRVASLQGVVNNATYETLSYCWGAEHANICISLHNDFEPEEQALAFQVRPNLYSALCTLRFQDRPRTLWVDAVCINQSDESEKSVQIPLMRQIFEGAVRTLVWLGESTSYSEPAIKLIGALTAAWDKCNGDIPTISKLKSDDMAQYGLPTFRSMDYGPLLKLLVLPWFERAWVVQEIIVSKSAWVYWGSERIHWKDFITAVFFVVRVEMPFVTHPAVNRLIAIADEDFFYRNKKCHLLSVLLRHRSCQATIPLDKVYAFMSLTEKGDGFIPIHIDYKQDLATAYTSIAKQIVQHDQSLDILSLPASPFRSTIPGLPTWVPDWNIVPNQKLRQGFSVEGISLANAEERGSRISKPFCATGFHGAQASRFAVFDQTTSSSKPLSQTSSSFILLDQTIPHALIVEGHRVDVIPKPVCNARHCEDSACRHGHNRRYDRYIRGRNDKGVDVILEWEEHIGLSKMWSSSTFSPPSRTQKYLTGEDLGDAFLETILVGNISPVEDKNDLRKQYFAWSAGQRYLRGQMVILSIMDIWGMIETGKLYEDVPETFKKRMQATIFRTFVKTEIGYIGLISGDVQPGDEIWILKGCKVPIVLRACGNDENWKVIGCVRTWDYAR
jgi:Heterokaryon incompatibility protein (HET)